MRGRGRDVSVVSGRPALRWHGWWHYGRTHMLCICRAHRAIIPGAALASLAKTARNFAAPPTLSRVFISVCCTRMAARLRRSVSSLALATWEIAEQKPAVLNLAIGQPALSLLPMDAVQDSAARLSSTYDARHILQYGAPAGSGHYLSALAAFLTAQLQCPHDPSTLFATTGNSGGLALVIRTLTKPGDAVLMEEPSYFLAHKLFRDYGCTLRPVRQRMDGVGTIDVEALGQSLEALAKATEATAGTGTPASMPRLLYCIPTGNNPTGTTMPDADRAKLVALCTQ